MTHVVHEHITIERIVLENWDGHENCYYRQYLINTDAIVSFIWINSVTLAVQAIEKLGQIMTITQQLHQYFYKIMVVIKVIYHLHSK